MKCCGTGSRAEVARFNISLASCRPFIFVLFAVVQINSFLSVDETTEKFPFSPSQKKTNAISQLGSFICAVSQSVRSLNPFLALRFKFRLPPNVQWPLFNFLDSIFRRYPLLLQIARR